VERALLLWERKIQLEREMQEALNPGVGNDVVRSRLLADAPPKAGLLAEGAAAAGPGPVAGLPVPGVAVLDEVRARQRPTLAGLLPYRWAP
jgi:hypothetical protein